MYARPVHACRAHLVDHVQCALKNGVEDLGDLRGDVRPQLVDDGCHGAEDLGVAGRWDVPLIVDEHRLQQGGHKVITHLGGGGRHAERDREEQKERVSDYLRRAT